MAKKLKLNPGEIVLLEAHAPALGKIFGVIPAGLDGRGILTNQRLVHFGKVSSGGLDMLSSLILAPFGELRSFEIPLNSIKSLERTFDRVNPAIIITTTGGKKHKLFSPSVYQALDFDLWLHHLHGALGQLHGRPLTQIAASIWTI